MALGSTEDLKDHVALRQYEIHIRSQSGCSHGSGANRAAALEVQQSLGGSLRLEREARRVYIHDIELESAAELAAIVFWNARSAAGRCTPKTGSKTLPDVVGDGEVKAIDRGTPPARPLPS